MYNQLCLFQRTTNKATILKVSLEKSLVDSLSYFVESNQEGIKMENLIFNCSLELFQLH
jgi:hypothetical protein